MTRTMMMMMILTILHLIWFHDIVSIHRRSHLRYMFLQSVANTILHLVDRDPSRLKFQPIEWVDEGLEVDLVVLVVVVVWNTIEYTLVPMLVIVLLRV